jgi:hypothetical protein
MASPKNRAAVTIVIASATIVGVAFAVPAYRIVRNGIAVAFGEHTRQAALREPAATQEWRQEFGDPAEMQAAFPNAEDNDAALRLIELAHTVGIDLTRGTSAPKRTSSETAAVSAYTAAELATPGGPVGTPPAVVTDHLLARRRAVGAIVDHLSGSDAPQWKRDVTSVLSDANTPNVAGILRLQELLAAHALHQASLGRESEPERTLLASWRLNASLRDRPDGVSQSIAIAVASMQVALARRVPVDPVAWRTRCADHDYRASLVRAHVAEALARLRALPKGTSRVARASRADFLDTSRRLLIGLRDAPVTDGSQDTAVSRGPGDDHPESLGVVAAMLSQPWMASTLRSADRLVLQTELTDRILHARIVKARLGRWPAEIPNNSASRMAGEHWRYSIDGDGQMTVSFSREIRAGPPLRYELGR